jgi:hypothetical protein
VNPEQDRAVRIDHGGNLSIDGAEVVVSPKKGFFEVHNG